MSQSKSLKISSQESRVFLRENMSYTLKAEDERLLFVVKTVHPEALYSCDTFDLTIGILVLDVKIKSQSVLDGANLEDRFSTNNAKFTTLVSIDANNCTFTPYRIAWYLRLQISIFAKNAESFKG